MTRTKLQDRTLPNYSAGEERFHMLSHAVGAVAGIVFLIACVAIAIEKQNIPGVVTSLIYGISVIALYTASSLYHGLKADRPKKIFQVIDHCTIYFMIVGTYTPIAVCSIVPINPLVGWGALAAVWCVAAVAIVLTAIDLHKYRKFSMVCYVGIGWSAVLGAKLILQGLAPGGIVLLLAGGLFYTVGAVLYGIGKKKRCIHAVYHVAVLLGSVLHFFCIALYVL